MVDIDKVNLVRYDFRGILNLDDRTKTGFGFELLQIPDTDSTQSCPDPQPCPHAPCRKHAFKIFKQQKADTHFPQEVLQLSNKIKLLWVPVSN